MRKSAKPRRSAPSRLVFERDGRAVWQGDCLTWLAAREPGRFSACVTDPPYELGFMGRKWDKSGISFDPETWRAVLRALRPGAHLVAFGGTRTFHRIACAIEDGGFEIRDTLMWVYGSGFPKSLDVSKAIDKVNGETGRLLKFTRWMRTTGLKAKQIDDALKQAGMISQTSNFAVHYFNDGQPAIPTAAMWKIVRPLCSDVPAWVDKIVKRIEAEREVIGQKKSSLGGTVAAGERNLEYISRHRNLRFNITAPTTPEATRWHGWGTALKPSWEPIILARKPLDGTVTEYVLRHGTGALNVDGCRIAGPVPSVPQPKFSRDMRAGFGASDGRIGKMSTAPGGRWPPNAVFQHDVRCVLVGEVNVKGVQRAAGSPGFGSGRQDGYEKGEGRIYRPDETREVYACVPSCPVRMLDGQSGVCTSGSRKAGVRKGMGYHGADGDGGPAISGSSGGASRFFYTPKASTAERRAGLSMLEDNMHPTVKPVALMEWLLRLVAPPGGEVLDPFAGSGSTLVAAKRLGIQAVGIDLDAEACETASARLTRRTAKGLGGTKKLKLGKRRRRK